MRRSAVVAAVLGALVVTQVAAGASSASKPTAKRAYASHPVIIGTAPVGTIRVILLVNPALTVAAGPDNVLGSQFVESGFVVKCQKNASGGFANPGMPKMKFRLKGGRYRISKSFTRAGIGIRGSTAAPAKMKMKLTAVVRSKTLIKGTLKVSGPGCNIGTHSYSAKILPADVVSPTL